MRRVAAIDCGTNSLRLLIADVDADAGRLVEVERRTTIVRLGQDVDRTGAFATEALARTFAVLDEYAEEIARLGVARLRFVATSAARDVVNRDAFVDGVVARLGVSPDVISGDEEARLSYDGTTRELVGDPAVRAPIVVVDVGGGSTELVTRSADGSIDGVSLAIGSVRMTERHLHNDPPSVGQIAAAVAEIEAALDRVSLPPGDVGTLIGVAGTVTTLAALVLGLSRYDRSRVHLASLPARDLLHTVHRIVAMPVAKRRELPVMHPGRADVIGGGALVLGRVVRRLGVDEVLVSEHDLLDGIAWSLA